jgi:hypothetical protein
VWILTEFGDSTKTTNTQDIWIQERLEDVKGIESLFKERVTESFPNLESIPRHKSQRSRVRSNSTNSTPKYMMLLRVKCKAKILKQQQKRTG